MVILLSDGIVAGLLAGILMIAISDIGYRIGIFKSSLAIIDGSFARKVIKIKFDNLRTYIFGIFGHLFTSAAFGGSYVFIINLLKLSTSSVYLVFLYVFFLWWSMLLIALPVAGQGFLGRKIGPYTWLEQLVLHVFYAFGLWGALRVL